MRTVRTIAIGTAVATLMLTTMATQAEVLMGINYHATLGDIKRLYPNATYEKLKPAWLTEEDAFIKISGVGLGGTLRVAFTDLRPAAKRLLAKEKDSSAYKKIAAQKDDDALTVEWVRLTYTAPVTLDTFKKRYGSPGKCEHDESFAFECEWPNRALTASMSADGKIVGSVATGFTLSEKQMGYTLKGEKFPPWLSPARNNLSEEDLMKKEYDTALESAIHDLQRAGIDLNGPINDQFDKSIRFFAQEAIKQGLVDKVGDIAASRSALQNAKAQMLQQYGK